MVVAGLSVLLSFVVATGLVSVGRAATTDARAQLAADATALAAVAEAGPGGSSQPAAIARRYAELNGARIVSCICSVGAVAVQVKVAIDDVTATARAEIDPSLFGPADASVNLNDLHPELRAAVDALIDAAKGAVWAISGYRSRYEQSKLWAQALARYGSVEAADDWVAPPGSSLHERGLAVDLGGDLVRAGRLIQSLGLPLSRPLADEPWHFELDTRHR